MSERGGNGGGPPINLTTILALLTLVGGLALGSKRLQSSRPLTPAGRPADSIGEQVLPARLWEDPFVDRTVEAGSGGGRPQSLADLGNQARTLHSDTAGVLILSVMVSGQPYGEDRESRVRARFAVISALGERGYAPEESTHLGTVETRWPTRPELEAWTQSGALARQFLHREPGDDLLALGSATLTLRYEWFRWRPVLPGPAKPGAPGNADRSTTLSSPVDRVLVLWLDESVFEDQPLTRLALFFDPLVPGASIPSSEPAHPPEVRILGPRSSTLLGALLGDRTTLAGGAAAPLRARMRAILGDLRLYSPTTTAMDPVLVKDPAARPPRVAVRERLRELGFQEAAFLHPDDAEMAGEVLAELELRGLGLGRKSATDHVVLIAEWDTFYGRTLALTYAARMATLTLESNQVPGRLADYVQGYREGRESFPPHFHSFVYQRGLDGQAVSGGAEEPAGRSAEARRRPSSFEELRDWTPDANQAEGRAQYDYLARLGERIEALDGDLVRDGRGRVRAVGIVGSDPYDTLLILQALRKRFPGALFFTTDLDARFWSPAETEWARNLIVISGYGTRLAPALQGATPPFRSSHQTATFAAALAALDHPDLATVRRIPTRRFEIGRRQAVDLSVAPNVTIRGDDDAPGSARRAFALHPPSPYERAREGGPMNAARLVRAVALLVALAAAVALALFFLQGMHPKGMIGFRRVTATLAYTRDDVGDDEGAAALLSALERPGEASGGSRLRDLARQHLRHPGPPRPAEALVEALNECLWDPEPSPTSGAADPAPPTSTQPSRRPPPASGFGRTLRNLRRWCRDDLGGGTWRQRKRLDAQLDRLVPPEASNDTRALLDAACDSRHAAREGYQLRRAQLAGATVAALGALLGGAFVVRMIRNDALGIPEGEPFSLTSGVSAWPAEALRLATGFLGAVFAIALHGRLRRSFFELTRRYRLPLASNAPDGPLPPGRVHATVHWRRLYQDGSFVRRVAGASPWVLTYLLLGSALVALGGAPSSPTRGLLLTGGVSWPSTVWLAGSLVVGAALGWAMRRDHPLRLGLFLAAHGLLTALPYLPGSPPPLDRILLWFGIGSFLFLTFMALETSLRCRRFIIQIGSHPTEYPLATRRRFSRQHGGVNESLLDEWIDVHLIADLTERIGALLWLPSIVLLLLLGARSAWWDRWSWTPGLLAVMSLNFLLVILCVVVVQQAARSAKRNARDQLTAKIRLAAASTQPTPEANDAAQARELLGEIEDLHRGAFVGFWQNPVVGALLVPSGGTVLIELAIWMLGR